MTTLHTAATANGQRASVVLEECGIRYDIRRVDFTTGEHRSEEFLALNPFGRIPVLQLDSGEAIYGSLAIGRYATRVSNRLLPAAADEIAFEHWLGVIMTDLTPAFAAKFYLGVLAPEPDQWANDWYQEIITRFLGIIDGHLADREFFLPCGFTLVDALMYPTAATSVDRMPGGLGEYPNIHRWAANVGQRDGISRGMAAST